MIRKGNRVLTSLEEWERFAGPKSAVQWQDYRSAKECARAWLERNDSTRIPEELERVLTSHPDFGAIREWKAEPESPVAFDEYGGPANIDVLVSGRDDRGKFTMAVEAKAETKAAPTEDGDASAAKKAEAAASAKKDEA